MIKIGLFFGSFNPFHIGHKVIGAHMVQHTDLDKVWYVVSPQNPQKEKKSLLNHGPSLNILLKLMSVVALVIAPSLTNNARGLRNLIRLIGFIFLMIFYLKFLMIL